MEAFASIHCLQSLCFSWESCPLHPYSLPMWWQRIWLLSPRTRAPAWGCHPQLAYQKCLPIRIARPAAEETLCLSIYDNLACISFWFYQTRAESERKWRWKSLSRVWLFAIPRTIQSWRIPGDGIFQARTLEWVAFPFSSVSSQPREQT